MLASDLQLHELETAAYGKGVRIVAAVGAGSAELLRFAHPSGSLRLAICLRRSSTRCATISSPQQVALAEDEPAYSTAGKYERVLKLRS